MPDLAAARSALRSRLPDREGREVVVEHEAPCMLTGDVLDLLLVVGRAECAAHQCLGLAAGEDDRAVHAGRTPVSVQIGRISSNFRPSRRSRARAPRHASPFPAARGRCARILPLLASSSGSDASRSFEHGIDLP